jgi:hypothetical protein
MHHSNAQGAAIDLKGTQQRIEKIYCMDHSNALKGVIARTKSIARTTAMH